MDLSKEIFEQANALNKAVADAYKAGFETGYEKAKKEMMDNSLGTEKTPEICECSECGLQVRCEHSEDEPHIAIKGCSNCHQELHPVEEEPF